MPRDLFVLRTNFFSSYCGELLAQISHAGKDVVVCADESKGVVDTADFAKVRMGLKSIDRLGLYRHEKSAWLCGDYFLYHVLSSVPDYDYYWLVEPDVYFDFDDISEFLRPLDEVAKDYVVMHYGERRSNWAWYDTVSPYFETVYGGPYPLVRLSKAALHFMLAQRQKLSSEYQKTESGRWPNDEAFTATFLANNKFKCSSFNDLGVGLFATKSSFRTGLPWLREYLVDKPRSNLVYHSALGRDDYIDKLKRHIRMRGRSGDGVDKIVSEYYGKSVLDELKVLEKKSLEVIRNRSEFGK
ncbi:hypothetical protein [Salinicola lusitanus]|uniref:hypothetical protein n=1 Tax=Salinicola lusitanus TaxID=1949085 RepID=UPI00138FDC9E|nr:hypothetical protein [Salinicola lusitanus]